MPRDITYCQGVRCKNKSGCERWVKNLKERQPCPSYYSMTTTFVDKKGNCSYYIPLDDAFEIPTVLKKKTREKKLK